MQNKVWILAFVLMVVTLGFGLVIPIIPFYMESLEPEVQSWVSWWHATP